MSERSYFDFRCQGCDATFELNVDGPGRISRIPAYCPFCSLDFLVEVVEPEDEVEEVPEVKDAVCRVWKNLKL